LYLLVHRAAAACCPARVSKIFELGHRCFSVLRQLADARGFFELVGREEQEAAKMLTEMMAPGPRVLDKFWLVKYESGECFVYHGHGFSKLEAEIPHRLTRAAAGRSFYVTNQGHGLDRSQAKPDVFRVFAKQIEPLFAKEERDARLTDFDRGFNVTQFFHDVMDERSGTGKRAVIKVQNAFPGITSRVAVKESEITYVDLTAIEVGCRDLENMVRTIPDLIRTRDVSTLRTRLKGAILTEVNAGLVDLAQRFLGASREENAHTLQMTVLFQNLFELLERGVQFCRDDANSDQRLDPLLARALEALRSKCQPYLMG
jgi:hypothetical protein